MTVLNKRKNPSLAELRAGHMPEWPSFIDVECEGLVYQVGYRAHDREYVAKIKHGDRYESPKLADIKDWIKSDAAPVQHKPVTVDGKTVGHVMNQHNEFFYRPVGTKVIGEKFWSDEPILQALRDQGMKLD